MISTYKKVVRRYRKAERIYTKSAKWKFRFLFVALLIAVWKIIEGVF